MARDLFGGSSDDYAVDTYGKPVTNRRVRFYTSAAMSTEITDLASDAAGTGSPLTVNTDAHGFWGPVYGPDAVTVMYAGAVDASGNPPTYVVAVYTHSSAAAGVASFNTRTGAVSLSKADVTGTALAAADVGADVTGAAASAQTAAQTYADTAVASRAKPRGAWAPTTAYAVNDVVTSGGAPYRCLVAHTSGASFSGAGTNWEAWGSAASSGSGISGAKADAVTLGDGAMTSGSAVLTSATAVFTSADVGKVVVVNNAKGAGTHLYGTISGFTNATTVTLSTSCTNTISAMPFTYGTDDTAAIQAAVTAAVAVGGTVQLSATPSVITAAIAVNGGCTIKGAGVVSCFGNDTNAGDLTPQTLPTVAPYLAGSVLAVCAANINAITINSSGYPVHIRDAGVYFAGQFKNTGHGIQVAPPALGAPASGQNNGMLTAKWDTVFVFGHDGSHYAFSFMNCLDNQFSNLMAVGGGGVSTETNSSFASYGAMLFTKFKHCHMGGSAHGAYGNGVGGDHTNVTFIQYSAIPGSTYYGTHYAAWALPAVSGDPIHMNNSHVYKWAFFSADVEYGAPFIQSYFHVSPDSWMPNAQQQAINVPYWANYLKRRLNADLSQHLESSETGGSVWWLLNDTPKGAIWGITTDGTVRMKVPGTLDWTGTPTVVGDAHLGTTPPPVLIQGGDGRGIVKFGSGASPASGSLAAVTFGRTLAAAPVVQLAPLNAATQALGLYVSAYSTTGFTIAAANAPSASQAVTTYALSYNVDTAGGDPAVPAVYDSYSKADSNTSVGSPQIGSAPTPSGASVWGISSNKAYVVSGTGDLNLLYEASKADVTVKVKLVKTGQEIGIIFRATDSANYFYSSPAGTLWKSVAGSWTNVGTTATFANGDVMSVVAVGSSISIYKNGLLANGTGSAFTNTYNQTATKHGLYSANSGTSGFQNFEVD